MSTAPPAVCNSFDKSWKYVHAQLRASRGTRDAIQTVLHVDMADMLADDAQQPGRQPLGRGWIGRFVGTAVSAGRTIGVRAAETVGTAVGDTVLTVRERMHQRKAEDAGAPAACGSAVDDASPAAEPSAEGGEAPRFKGLFGRVAVEGEHASAAEIGERLNWGVRGLAQRSASVMGQVASHTRGLASELRQKAAVTVHNTRARLAQRDEIEAETVTFALRFEKNEGTKALAELERSSVTQLERLRALQAEAGPTLLGLVDSAFLNLHQLLDLPMELDGEAFSDPQHSDELQASIALSGSSERSSAALAAIAARFARDVGTLVTGHLSRTQALQQQAVSAAAEADAAEGDAAGETGAAQQVRLAVYARRAVVNSTCETIDRFSDVSLHALAELAACTVKALLELEREFNSSLNVATTPDTVLTAVVPARAAAVRLVAHSMLTELKAVRAVFRKAAADVSDECANLCSVPFEDGDVDTELAPVRTKATDFNSGLDVDAASAASIAQDAVQFMLPIIKALALAEVQVVAAKSPRMDAADAAGVAADAAGVAAHGENGAVGGADGAADGPTDGAAA